MAALGYGVPDEDVTVQAVGVLAGCGARVGYPVVVVGGAHFVWVAVLEDPADADDEHCGVELEHFFLSLLSGQVGEAVEDIFGVDECKLIGQVGVFVCF